MRTFISMTLPQPNKQRCPLKNLARLPLSSTIEKKEDLSAVTSPVDTRNLLEEVKKAIEMLCEAMNIACKIYITDSRDPKDPEKASAGERAVKSVDLLLCDSP